jgi:hypothetical protein
MKGSLHEFEIEPDRWSGPHTQYFEIMGSSYPTADNIDNQCDSCGAYSDYFIEGYTTPLSIGSPFFKNTRLCNTCIIKLWFGVLFDMSVPDLGNK